ncbi:MAG TPA: ScyD/ScyE family protein [Thermomicrobiales bacterium]|nr:ScyD/ScyE family protein [Thermomicrobiales bacterium]
MLYGEGEEQMERCLGLTGTVTLIADDSDACSPNAQSDALSGLPSVTFLDSTGDDAWEIVADASTYVAEANPDGAQIDSNPFSFVMVADGFVVADAGPNALLHVALDGTISTLAVFAPTTVDAPPFLELAPGTQIPMEAVPTGLTLGPDGT